MERSRYTLDDVVFLIGCLRVKLESIERAGETRLSQEYLRSKDVAELLGVSEVTVRNYIKAGKLTAYKPGAHYIITAASVRTFLESCRVK